MVTTSAENMARTWDIPTGNPIATFPHRGEVTCCAIRGDGMMIATGSDDTTARLWDAQTGEPVSPPLKHPDRVIFVAFREGGNQLVTVTANAVIRVWVLDDGTPSARLAHLARATSGLAIDENSAAVALKPEQIEAEWNAANSATSADSR
jgi:WD40 repeat protein